MVPAWLAEDDRAPGLELRGDDVEPATELAIVVDLTADMTIVNPFDFFVEPYAEHYPFAYAAALAKELNPFLETEPLTPRLADDRPLMRPPR